MNNDLISREALREAINTYDTFACLPDGKLYPVRELEHPEMFVTYIHVEDVIKAIDNAPTVDVKDQIAGAYNEGYMCESREAEKARPQGEITNEDIQQAIKEGFANGYEMAKTKLVTMLNDRIEESVCKYCQMNKHCELCEISRVFSIIALTDEEMKGGAEA